MAARLVVLSGTGTGVGKTQVAEGSLLAWGEMGVRAAGFKPVESGVDGTSPSDGDRLAAASPFHVQPTLYALRTPVSPHLAARQEGVPIDLVRIRDAVEAARASVDILLVELPGGLFSPLTEDTPNAVFASSLKPDALILVAPDRLGVLHDVSATVRAATTVPVSVDGIVLVAPEVADRSTGTNGEELARLLPVPNLAAVPRGSPKSLVPSLRSMARVLLG
jgi:dethiobiotin synthetase